MNETKDKTSQEKKQDKDSVKEDSPEEPTKKRVFKGLCINCEHRFTCTLPRPETGVWYCEEYE